MEGFTRIKAALSISAPSKPLNAAIDGLVLTLVDHAAFGLAKWMLLKLHTVTAVALLLAIGRAIATPPSLPGKFGGAFADAGGFPIIISQSQSASCLERFDITAGTSDCFGC